MRIPFHQIDAFADRPFTGNPAAVLILESPLDDATCQAIAAENNIAETAFLVRRTDGVADFDLRWFTPAVEVALCGHATLASGHWALMRDRSRNSVTFATWVQLFMRTPDSTPINCRKCGRPSHHAWRESTRTWWTAT